MRLVTLIASLLFCISATTIRSSAQESHAVVEPDYANSFFFLQPDNTLKPLERQTAAVSTKIHAFGYGGGEAVAQIENEHSTVRFVGTPPAFVVKLADQNLDPQTLISIFPLQVQKGKRQLSLVRSHFLSGGKNQTQGKQIAFTFSKYGKSSIKITIDGILQPGEYEISTNAGNTANTVYCFSVDTAP